MGQVTASQSVDIAAAPDQVLAALSDYTETRPAILPEQYRDYRVITGGTGEGTEVHWILQATSKRQRDVHAVVSVTADSVTEKDHNSTMVTTYRVTPAGAGSRVEVTTTWQGAGGIKGFFEKTFAPKGLAAIYESLLGNLKTRLEA